jgi:hypothetical protein
MHIKKGIEDLIDVEGFQLMQVRLNAHRESGEGLALAVRKLEDQINKGGTEF